jgi:hypothetical protein
MHFLDDMPFCIVENFLVINSLEMVDIDFVFIGDLIMDKIVLNLKSFADRWCNVHILALISEVVRCSSMEELSSTLLLFHDWVHVYAS